MPLVLKTAPVERPITLSEAKSYSRIESDVDDKDLETLIDSAVELFDGRDGILGRALITQSWELKLEAFPDGPIELKLAPVQSVTSLKYFDEDGAEQTMVEGTDFVLVEGLQQTMMIYPASGTTWPATMSPGIAVIVEIVCGYGDGPEAVPARIKHAIVATADYWYDDRSGTVDVPQGVVNLVAPFKVY